MKGRFTKKSTKYNLNMKNIQLKIVVFAFSDN